MPTPVKAKKTIWGKDVLAGENYCIDAKNKNILNGIHRRGDNWKNEGWSDYTDITLDSGGENNDGWCSYRFPLNNKFFEDELEVESTRNDNYGSYVRITLQGDTSGHNTIQIKNLSAGVMTEGWKDSDWIYSGISSPNIVKNSLRKVTVNGESEFEIPANGSVITDPFFLPINQHLMTCLNVEMNFWNIDATYDTGSNLFLGVLGKHALEEDWSNYSLNTLLVDYTNWMLVKKIEVLGGADTEDYDGLGWYDGNEESFGSLPYALQRYSGDFDTLVIGSTNKIYGEWEGVNINFTEGLGRNNLITTEIPFLDRPIEGTHTGDNNSYYLEDTTKFFTAQHLGLWVEHGTTKGGYIYKIISETIIEIRYWDTGDAKLKRQKWDSGDTYTILGGEKFLIDTELEHRGIDIGESTYDLTLQRLEIINSRPSVEVKVKTDLVDDYGSSAGSLQIDFGNGVIHTFAVPVDTTPVELVAIINPDVKERVSHAHWNGDITSNGKMLVELNSFYLGEQGYIRIYEDTLELFTEDIPSGSYNEFKYEVQNGGAIRSSQPNVTIVESNFKHNIACKGSAIYSTGENLEIGKTIFRDNINAVLVYDKDVDWDIGNTRIVGTERIWDTWEDGDFDDVSYYDKGYLGYYKQQGYSTNAVVHSENNMLLETSLLEENVILGDDIITSKGNDEVRNIVVRENDSIGVNIYNAMNNQENTLAVFNSILDGLVVSYSADKLYLENNNFYKEGHTFNVEGCSEEDPKFVITGKKGGEGNNLHLKSVVGQMENGVFVKGDEHSNLIDSTETPYYDELQPNGDNANIGMYGTTDEASLSDVSLYESDHFMGVDKFKVTEKNENTVIVEWDLGDYWRERIKALWLRFDQKTISLESHKLLLDKYSKRKEIVVGKSYPCNYTDRSELVEFDLELGKLWHFKIEVELSNPKTVFKSDTFIVPFKTQETDEIPDKRGKGISYPFSFSRDGKLAISEGTYKIRESILMLLETYRNERVMRPYLGSGLRSKLFGNVSDIALTKLKMDIEGVLKVEPRISVNEVFVEHIENEDEGSYIQINIDYTDRQTGQRDTAVYPFKKGG